MGSLYNPFSHTMSAEPEEEVLVQTFDALFAEGSLGLVLLDTNQVKAVVEGGQAATLGVVGEDLLVEVNGESIDGLVHEAVVEKIKAAGRPIRLTFARPSSLAAASNPGALARLPRLKLPSASEAAGAVKKAGNFMKGLLGAGIQVIAGMDKIVGGALDASIGKGAVSALSLCCTHHPACFSFTPLTPFSIFSPPPNPPPPLTPPRKLCTAASGGAGLSEHQASGPLPGLDGEHFQGGWPPGPHRGG